MTQPYIFAVIPARGDSKGLIQKNTRLLGGLPLIAHTLRAAQTSRLLTRAIVSTDDLRITAVAREHGGEVPFRRPEHLATDTASTLSVVLHALGWLETAEKILPDIVVLLQPTAPLRTAEDIDAALTLLLENKVDSVVSFSPPLADNPYYAYASVRGEFVPLKLVVPGTRRQDLPEPVMRNGAIYAIRRDALISTNNFYGRKMLPYFMPPERGINIDNDLTLALAEFLLGRAAQA
ncbi:MAG: acylneuraminate cytidylyltransferase family protein [Anaerolineae bacterium]|nr:MAG: acylneuraminate cytidylyltransferase family protein [Anaerolineae bacterium]